MYLRTLSKICDNTLKLFSVAVLMAKYSIRSNYTIEIDF